MLREFNKAVEGQPNYASLITKRMGNQNAKKVTDETEALLNSMFAGQQTKPTYEEVYRTYEGFLSGYVQVINNHTGDPYSPKGFPSLKRRTIQNYLNQWRNKIGNEAIRAGDRLKIKAKLPFHDLARPIYSGSIISIDDRQPPFEYEKGKRMWFYLGVDVASGAVVSWAWGTDKKDIIIPFYRNMVRVHAHYGKPLPHELECEANLNSQLKATLLADGSMFQRVRIEPNNPQGKWIEQGFNRKMRYGIEKQAQGWIARPHARGEANQVGSAPVPIIPYDQLVQARLADIETWNNQEHPEHAEESLFEYWLNHQHPELKPINWRGILPYLGYKTDTSCRRGNIRLDNHNFLLGLSGEVATGDTLLDLLDIVEGKDVKVYWLDTLTTGQVLKALVYVNDEYVCEAIAKPSYNKATIEQTPDQLLARELMSAYENTVTSYMKRSAKSVERVMVIDNTPQPERKFRMPGLVNYEPSEQEAEVIDQRPAQDPEQLPAEAPGKISFIDRF